MQTNIGYALKGKRVAVLMTDGVEQVEYTEPRAFLEAQGAIVTLMSPKGRGEQVQGKNHDADGDTFTVEMHVRDAKPGDFDALLLPGGEENPKKLRQSAEAIDFIRQFALEDKPIAAICHGPLALIDAGIAQARHLTSWPESKGELVAAGAEWSDEEVVIDDKLITSRKPADIPAFNDALFKELRIDAQVADMGPSS
ncbi:type 1 glutamine amidotransferase domain-containing protein [Massilia sp. GCM10020059]|uniref:Type 1 glutamine amidotransferase n=1 Tax=Massilia agrisoli TaxID=2892444 RepID=A0ABS8IQK8_9BURK|nr:type 1 glutamine amidotransferase domain-containing protein [Massilia agrisoli]MCC6070122.1 type 1 glutamine amidotransferase [Massilia agrisoli]